MNNWLCNLTGVEGCWFPMDLLQEKNIKQLKKMVQKRDASFGGNFFKNIVALNIRAFLQVISSMRTMARLGEKGGTHRRQKKEAAMKELRRHMEEHGVHKFRAGRNQGHIAHDDFEAGYHRFKTTPRISEFITRTLRDAGAIHDAGDDIAHTMPRDIQDNGPFPNIMVEGTLVVSDEDARAEVDEEWNMNLQMKDLLLTGNCTDAKDGSDTDEGTDNDSETQHAHEMSLGDGSSSGDSGDSSLDEGDEISCGSESAESNNSQSSSMHDGFL